MCPWYFSHDLLLVPPLRPCYRNCILVHAAKIGSLLPKVHSLELRYHPKRDILPAVFLLSLPLPLSTVAETLFLAGMA